MHSQHAAGKCSLTGFAFLLFLAAPGSSQTAGGPPPIDRRTNPDRARQQDMSSREYQLRNFGNQPGSNPDRRKLESLMVQTEEDFNRILTLHNEIARFVSSDKPVDYRFISDATAEIKKRATRLQSTLVLRQPPSATRSADDSEEFDYSQIKPALIKLCKHIKSFVTNPIIETPNTVNADELAKARRELESLIQLSGQIKKDADRLSKSRK